MEKHIFKTPCGVVIVLHNHYSSVTVEIKKGLIEIVNGPQEIYPEFEDAIYKTILNI